MKSVRVGLAIALFTISALAALYYLRALGDRPASATNIVPSPAELGLLVLGGGAVGWFAVIVGFYVAIGVVTGWLSRRLKANGTRSALIASTIVSALTLPPALVDSGSSAFGPWIVGSLLATTLVTLAAMATGRLEEEH